MAQNDKIQLFEDKRIRTAWDEEKEEWYFSIVDVCEVLSGTDNPRRYWSDLKRKLKSEGAVELYEKIVQLKMTAPDGKKRLTDVADTEQLLRIVQSIPSPKAEPFRAWLAQVGRERIEETIDPELTIERALETYLKKGYTREWINQRLQAIQVRKELTDEWDARGVQKGVEYAILTDEISRAWSGMSTRQYKNLKGLKKENLRDNMTTLELVLNMLAEATTTQFSKDRKPTTFQENLEVAKAGGAWDLLRRPCGAPAHQSGLRQVRPADRHGRREPAEYAPHLRRRLCRQAAPPDGLHRPPPRCCRPVVHGRFRGNLAGCADGVPGAAERIVAVR